MRRWEAQLKPENIINKSCISAWHKLQCRLIWSTSLRGKKKKGSVTLESVLFCAPLCGFQHYSASPGSCELLKCDHRFKNDVPYMERCYSEQLHQHSESPPLPLLKDLRHL